MTTERAQIREGGCRGYDDGLRPHRACPGGDFNSLAAGANAPHGRPLEDRGAPLDCGFREAEAGAKWIEHEAARPDGGAPIDGRLPRQRGRRHPGVIEARGAPGVILTAQPPDRLRITADDRQQVLRREVASDVLPLDRRRQIERGPPLSLPERPGHAQAV